MAHPNKACKRKQQSADLRRAGVAEHKAGPFTTRVEADLGEVASLWSARQRARAERRAGAAPHEKSSIRVAPDMYHDRIDAVHRLIAYRHGTIPWHKQELFLEAYFNSLVRSGKRSKKKVSPQYLINCAKKHIRNLKPGIAQQRAERACSEPQNYIAAGEYGYLLDLRFEECLALLGTPTIYPVDRAPDYMQKFNRRMSRLRKCKANNKHVFRATYESTSAAAFCRAHGISERTWYRHHAKGQEALEAYLKKRGVLTEWQRFRSIKKEVSTVPQLLPYRPKVAPGDMPPDDADAIPVRRDDDDVLPIAGANNPDMPSEPSQSQETPVDGARQAEPKAKPAAAAPLDDMDARLLEIDRQLADPDIDPGWRRELTGLRRELCTAVAIAGLEREAIADAA